jgi:hypothetical protein
MKAELARLARYRCAAHILDHSRADPNGAAIYTLSDPRDLYLVRYVGQTRAPRARYLQHVSAAKLWMPDERPWWIKSPQQRPLYHWIRDLYNDEKRLPMMVVVAWTAACDAITEERHHIANCLQQGLPLLNREAEPSKKKPVSGRAGRPATRKRRAGVGEQSECLTQSATLPKQESNSPVDPACRR